MPLPPTPTVPPPPPNPHRILRVRRVEGFFVRPLSSVSLSLDVVTTFGLRRSELTKVSLASAQSHSKPTRSHWIVLQTVFFKVLVTQDDTFHSEGFLYWLVGLRLSPLKTSFSRTPPPATLPHLHPPRSSEDKRLKKPRKKEKENVQTLLSLSLAAALCVCVTFMTLVQCF